MRANHRRSLTALAVAALVGLAACAGPTEPGARVARRTADAPPRTAVPTAATPPPTLATPTRDPEPRPTSAPVALVDPRQEVWRLTELDGEASAAALGATLEFHGGKRPGHPEIEARTECLFMGAPYTMRGGRIAISRRGVHRADFGCPDGSSVRRFDRFVEALRDATAFRATVDRLEIVDASGHTVLGFDRTRPPPFDPALAGRWLPRSLLGKRPISGTAPVLVVTEGEFSGTAGCNSLAGELLASGRGAWRAGPIVQTAMGCGGALGAQEGAYLRALYAARAYRATPNLLEMLDARGKTTAVFGRAVGTPVSRAVLAETAWELVAVNGEPAAWRTPGRLMFGREHFTASMGCWTLAGGYDVGERGMALVSRSYEHPACPAQAGTTRAQREYFAGIQATDRYRVRADRLELLQGAGQRLVFRRR